MCERPLIEMLEAYRPTEAEDAEARRRMLEFARREPACFERGTTEGHFTASAWLLDPAHDRVLLTLHRKLGKWLQPGGHADGDPDLARVALREAREESGLEGIFLLRAEPFDLDVHAIPARPGEPEHFHYDARFLAVAPVDGPLLVSDESHELAWWEREAVAGFEEESLLRMLRKTPRPTP